jgi:hypothetical protein
MTLVSILKKQINRSEAFDARNDDILMENLRDFLEGEQNRSAFEATFLINYTFYRLCTCMRPCEIMSNSIEENSLKGK